MIPALNIVIINNGFKNIVDVADNKIIDILGKNNITYTKETNVLGWFKKETIFSIDITIPILLKLSKGKDMIL